MIMLLFAAVAAAASPTASVGLGMEFLPGLGEVSRRGTAVRAALQWHLGSLEFGPLFQTSAHNAQNYQIQSLAGTPTVPGDFYMIGAGPSLALPTLVETQVLRVGVHADVLGEYMQSPMDPIYYQEDVVERAFEGTEPRVGLSQWMLRPGVGIDLALSLSTSRPGPELYVGGDVALRTTLGLAVMPVVGVRVGAGE